VLILLKNLACRPAAWWAS